MATFDPPYKIKEGERPPLVGQVNRIFGRYGLFTLADPDFNSDLRCKPNDYVVLYRTFHTSQRS